MNHARSDSQWVSFHIGGEVCALPVDCIREITPYREPNPVPGAPAAVEGIVNVRGQMVTVTCGHRWLEDNISQEAEPDSQDAGGPASHIILLDLPGGAVGVTTDAIGDLLHIDNEAVDSPPSGTSGRHIHGVARHNDELIILMNPPEPERDTGATGNEVDTHE